MEILRNPPEGIDSKPLKEMKDNSVRMVTLHVHVIKECSSKGIAKFLQLLSNNLPAG